MPGIRPFAVSAVTCDCDLLLRSPAGFSPATPADLSTLHDATFTVYVVPRTVGAVSFSADLESTSGAHQTVTFSGTADRVIAIAAACMKIGDGDGQPIPCGASRAPNDNISIEVSATTGAGVRPLSDLVNDAGAITGDTAATALPTMSPDAASWVWGNTGVDPTTTATAETLRWTVGDTTLTATVAIPPIQR